LGSINEETAVKSISTFVGVLALSACSPHQEPMNKFGMGLQACQNQFNATFSSMGDAINSLPSEQRFQLLLGAVKVRFACEDKVNAALKAAVSNK